MPRATGTYGSKASLLFRMIDLIKARPGIKVAELAAELGRSKRTIFRYLVALSADLNVPVYTERDGYYLMPGSDLRPLNLTADEATAVRAGLESSVFGPGTPLGEVAKSALCKIQAALRESEAGVLREMNGRFTVSATVGADYSEHQDIMAALHRAVRGRRRLRLIYRSSHSHDPSELIADPYALTFRRHSWYCLAWSQKHGKVIQLKPIRILSAEETGETFGPPEDFSVERFYQKSWEVWAGGEEVTVKVRFSSQIAPIIREGKRHPSQRIEDLPDGSLVFTVTVSGLEEIGSWIMGWGSAAEVLEPAELRARILKAADEMVAIYRGGQTLA